jgi:hypothetical protein
VSERLREGRATLLDLVVMFFLAPFFGFVAVAVLMGGDLLLMAGLGALAGVGAIVCGLYVNHDNAKNRARQSKDNESD